MIQKFFELKNIKFNNYLFYGENFGLKKEVIENNFYAKLNKSNIFKYNENEIIKDKQLLFDHYINGSFFEEEKLIIISNSTDRILNIIEDIIELDNSDTKLILLADKLETKSKLRKFFEKEKKLICTPFYKDEDKSLRVILENFFLKRKIKVSQEILNIIINRAAGDRGNLKNEIEKIDNFLINKTSINKDDLMKITNLSEDIDRSELVDHCLAKNKIKVLNILNENNFANDEIISLIRIFIAKTKRLLVLSENLYEEKDINSVINNFKPPIFWKDKEIVKKQLREWTKFEVIRLLNEIQRLELSTKKNTSISKVLLLNFILDIIKN